MAGCKGLKSGRVSTCSGMSGIPIAGGRACRMYRASRWSAAPRWPWLGFPCCSTVGVQFLQVTFRNTILTGYFFHKFMKILQIRPVEVANFITATVVFGQRGHQYV